MVGGERVHRSNPAVASQGHLSTLAIRQGNTYPAHTRPLKDQTPVARGEAGMTQVSVSTAAPTECRAKRGLSRLPRGAVGCPMSRLCAGQVPPCPTPPHAPQQHHWYHQRNTHCP
uniref:Uncharacterized protein n=1 Tax=Eutreptiella gymnastica TaxID=73025 RepID=A0A7S1NIW6_9EUGL